MSAAQAFLDGQIARLRGEPAQTNPHPLSTHHSRRWAAGWRSLDDARDVPPVRCAS